METFKKLLVVVLCLISSFAAAKKDPFYSQKNVFDVAVSGSQACSIVEEGIECAIGEDRYVIAPPKDSERFVQLSLSHNLCAVTRSGQILCWDQDQDQDQNPIASLDIPTDKIYLQVQVSYYFGCALDTTGTVYCGSFHKEFTDKVPQIGTQTDVTAMAISQKNICLLKSDGSANCFGENAPVIPADLNFSQISNGNVVDGYMCGVTTDRKVRCFAETREVQWNFMENLTNVDSTFAIIFGDGVGVLQNGKAAVWSRYWRDGDNSKLTTFDDYSNVKRISMGAYVACVLDVYRNLDCFRHGLHEQ